MPFDKLLHNVRELLEDEGRVAYRVLKRRFELDDEDIEDIKADLIDAKHLAYDEDGRVLVWAGGAEAVAAGRPVEPAPVSVPQHADRRLITVMFCDIVGSTELSARFDAEELREIVREYQRICAAVIERCDGHIAQYLGDGLLVYFGYPAALEDEAGRAVQAALEILHALHHATDLEQRLGERLRVRIGIHTGTVVIGKMGGASRQEHLALGETPNIAARVQSAARPDEILITAATQRLVDGLYECDLHGPHTLKGVAEPVKLYTVKGEAAPLNRFEVALSTGALTPFVGRQQELQLFARHWQQATTGNGQVVLLSGEAGMGKSRLVQQFKKEVSEQARQIILRCSPNHANSAFYPIANLLRRVFALSDDEDDSTSLARIARTLSDYAFPKADTAILFAELLDLPHPDAEQIASLSPQARKLRTFNALVEWLIEESTLQPLFIIWDDVHWMDSATHELLEKYLDHIPASRTFVVLVYRSDFSPPWATRSFLAPMRIARLPDDEVDALIQHVAEGEVLPAAMCAYIRNRTDGIPLYVEELTKTIVESGLLAQVDGANTADLLKKLAIPTTLQDSLEARLDHCPNGKHVAQWGAVIGREFSRALLAQVVTDAALLARGLSELLEAELVYRSGTRAERSYIFKHALIRDTAYESLLNKYRRQHHAAVADALEQFFPDIVEREPELLAHHFTEAGIHHRAVEHLHEAAERAIELSVGTLAQGHLRKALEIIAALPDGGERAGFELKTLLLLGPLVSASRGNASLEVEKIYLRALKLCDVAGDKRAKFPAYFGLRAYYLATADLNSAHRIGQALYKAASGSGHTDSLLEANVALASSYFFRGEIAEVERYCAEGLKLYDRTEHARHAHIYGIDPGSLCLVRSAQCAWLQGRPEQAAVDLGAAVALVNELGHSVSRAFIYINSSTVHGWAGDYEQAVREATSAIEIAAEFDISFTHGWSLIQRGHATVQLGRHDAGLTDISAGLALLERSASRAGMRSQLMYSWFAALMADAYGAAGAVEKGLALLSEALELVERTGARYPESVLYRVRGELMQRLGLHVEARKSLRCALDIAHTRGARGFELQAALSLCRCSAEGDHAAEALASLRAVTQAFAEGFQSRDWLEASRLLGTPDAARPGP